MKTQDLIDLGLSQEVAEKIFVLHGKDIEKLKESTQTATADLESIKTQLTEANTQIEKFKGMKTQEEVDAAVSEYKTKFEQAEVDAAANLLAVKRNHALERDLKEVYKVKNVKAVMALLNNDELTFDEKTEAINGLKEQVEPIKASDGYLFTDTKEPPKIIAGGKSKSVLGDPIVDAARKAAGLVPEQK